MICLVTWPTAHYGLLQLIPSSPEEAPIQADSNANHAHAPTEYSGKTAPHGHMKTSPDFILPGCSAQGSEERYRYVRYSNSAYFLIKWQFKDLCCYSPY